MTSKKKASMTVKNDRSISRFSRRRFIHASAITSPILLSVKSPVAWAVEFDGSRGSLAQFIMHSANTSKMVSKLAPRIPSYWANNFFNKNHVVNNVLMNNGYSPNKTFFEYCDLDYLHTSQSWEKNPDIKYSLKKTTNSTLFEALQGATGELIIECAYDGEIKNINIVRNAPLFFINATCALLNSLFHPEFIEYFDENDIKNDIVRAIDDSINEILNDINIDSFKGENANYYSEFMKKLSEDLDTWN